MKLQDMKPPQFVAVYTSFFGGWLKLQDGSYLQVVDVAPPMEGEGMGKLTVQPLSASGARAGGLQHPTPADFTKENFAADAPPPPPSTPIAGAPLTLRVLRALGVADASKDECEAAALSAAAAALGTPMAALPTAAGRKASRRSRRG